MAIRSADEVALATRIGVFWSFAGLAAAIAVGISGYQYFAPPSYAPLADAEQVFVALTNALFSPLLAGVLLAAILAAIMSTVDSQLLVSSAALAEDLYPQLRQWLTPHRRESERERLWVARLAVVGLAAVATLLALNPESSVLGVVSYAWAGLGAGLGPVVLLSLFWPRMTAAGAVAGLLVGATTVLVWGNLSGGLFDLYELLPAFVAALLAVVAVSALGAHGDCDARLTALRRN
jgi:sodium/proline symporter